MQTRQEITTPLTVDAWNSCYEALSLELSNKKESLAQEQQEQLESIKSGIEEMLRKESQATVIHGHAFTPQIEALQNLYDALIKQTDPVELKGLSHIIQTFLQNNPRVLEIINPNDISNGRFIIPFGVTSIGAYAFYECTALASITIPASVTSIGDYAFDNCTALASVTIPVSVTSIGLGAFLGCTALASITIPDSVTSIDVSTFCGCTALAFITIPVSVTLIDAGAFSGCTALNSITIPASVTSIGSYAFEGCASLTTVMIDARTPESYEKVLNLLPKNLQDKAKRSSFKERFVTTVVNEGYKHGFFGSEKVLPEVTKIILTKLGQTYGFPPINGQAITLDIKEDRPTEQPLSSQKNKRKDEHDDDSNNYKRRRLNNS